MTATRSNTNARFRARKLSTKNPLQIVTEDQIDTVDDDPQRAVAEIETGVDKNEETEHHLQAAISASQAAAIGGKVAQSFIPTPDASKTIGDYDKLYKKRFKEPVSYIRFSSTVEDCSGCLYSIREEDDEFIRKANASRTSGSKLTDDVFESVMQHFEATTSLKQPFLGWNNDDATAHLLPLEDMETEFDPDVDDDNIKNFAKLVYPHWKDQRLKRHGRPIMPTLKFEQGQIDKDESDPYVCFRRREHRPARKTRRTDTQSIQKLKDIRSNLEDGKELILQVLQRETKKQESLKLERAIFENRSAVKDVKRKLGIKGDDEDLVNKQPRKRQAVEQPTPVVKAPQARQDGKSQEADLVSLDDRTRIKKLQILRGVEERRILRTNSNAGWVDRTTQALEKPSSRLRPEIPASYGGKSKFRPVHTMYRFYPPTPSDSPLEEGLENTQSSSSEEHAKLRFRPRSIKREASGDHEEAMFRARSGRFHGSWVDRKNFKISKEDMDGIDERIKDRYKFDHDDSDDDMPDSHPHLLDISNHDPQSDIKCRADLFMQQVLPNQQVANRRPQVISDNSGPNSTHPHSGKVNTLASTGTAVRAQ